ncbi:hypothetical protein [Autumnicola musiva]|uniref:Uncharacterized protein n=1 Tax=Autumnicola musiva TaxID=3075589 RepID=A0ABU3DBD5_9FLAO|nr:hypothetical protein [Zunongwangia sp. F117]MDT0678832.1 hypothetical protein [Zunongwangia sp. F117]
MFKKNVHFKGKKSTSFKTKGDRLGWVSVREAKSVSLKKALSDGKEVVHFNKSDKTPLLVP